MGIWTKLLLPSGMEASVGSTIFLYKGLKKRLPHLTRGQIYEHIAAASWRFFKRPAELEDFTERGEEIPLDAFITMLMLAERPDRFRTRKQQRKAIELIRREVAKSCPDEPLDDYFGLSG